MGLAANAVTGKTREHGPSLNHFVGAQQYRLRNREAERLRCLEVDDKVELGRLLDRQVGRIGALENLVHIASGATEKVSKVRSIGHQAPEFHLLPIREHAWQPSA